MLKVVARSIARKDKIDEIIELSRELAEASRNETGCISYEMYQDTKDSSIFVMIETWENIEAFNKHGQSNHVQRIVPKLNELRKEKAVVNIYKKAI